MEGLVNITYNDDRITVSSRELHEFLGLTERFNSWFERMLKYGFEEGVDYVGCKVFNTLSVTNTKWTQKGRLFIYELLKENGILPLVER